MIVRSPRVVAALMDVFSVGGGALFDRLCMCLGVVAILLLNGMDVFSVGGGALFDRLCMVFQRVCVLCQ